MCTPAGEGAADARWDTWRICEFAEILGFYGLQYWYTWQVSVLGLGPIWMSKNEAVRRRTAQALEDGGIFAFGLSEKAHGADIYSTDMVLTPAGDGWTGERPQVLHRQRQRGGDRLDLRPHRRHRRLRLLRRRPAPRALSSDQERRREPELRLRVRAPRLSGRAGRHPAPRPRRLGRRAQHRQHRQVQPRLGLDRHLHPRLLRGDHPRPQPRPLQDARHRLPARAAELRGRLLSAGRDEALRAARRRLHARSRRAEDRRYLLYNPMVKMKVTTQGEEVINLLWDTIAAKGFEKDMYFSQAATDIRGLPKLEGTVHVNIALIVKFMPNFFFAPAEYPAGRDAERGRGTTISSSTRAAPRASGRSSSTTTGRPSRAWSSRTCKRFAEQAEVFRELLASDPPGPAQMKDVAFLLAGGEIFALVVYAQLILENAPDLRHLRRPPRPDLRLHGPRHVEVRAAALQPAVEHGEADGVLPAHDPEGGPRPGALRPRVGGARWRR